MTFHANLIVSLKLDEYGDMVQKYSNGSIDYFTYEVDQIVQIRTNGLDYGDLRLYRMNNSGEGKTFILDVPSETVYFEDDSDIYRSCPATITKQGDKGYITSITFDPVESGELGVYNKSAILDEILHTNNWVEGHEYIKAYLIVQNLDQLI